MQLNPLSHLALKIKGIFYMLLVLQNYFPHVRIGRVFETRDCYEKMPAS
jgi:hypothetical protein